MEAGTCDLYSAVRWAYQGSAMKARAFGESLLCRELAWQVAHATAYCHSRGVAHRDIKPENILLFPDASMLGSAAAQEAADRLPALEATLPLRCGDPVGVDPAAHAVLQRHTAQRALLQTAMRCLWAPHEGPGGAPDSLDVPAAHPDAAAVARGFYAKLCDFGALGVADLPPPGQPQAAPLGRTPRGTARYAGPEVMALYTRLNDRKLARILWPASATRRAIGADGYDGFAADAWSFGVTVYALATGKTPWRIALPHCSAFRAYVLATQRHVLTEPVMAPGSSVWAGEDTPAWAWPAEFGPALVHLLESCLRVRPEERCSLEDAKAHPWFRDPDWLPSGAPPTRSMGLRPDTSSLGGMPATSTTALPVSTRSDPRK